MDQKELQKIIDSSNLCEDYIDEGTQIDIGKKVCEWYDEDEDSRKEWKQRNEQWMKLATQVVEKKTYPWPNAANVKFPLLTTAAMQFAARAYPALVPGIRLVGGQVIGKDADGKKAASADRVGAHMSYQVMYEMPGWEEDMDRLCLMLPIIGCLFKKTYRDEMEDRNNSDLILPEDFVLDYYAKSVEAAYRKHHVIWRTKNEVLERINAGIYVDFSIGLPKDTDDHKVRDEVSGTRPPRASEATPHKFLECHTFWDLDDDGYAEPYIFTVHYETQKLVRAVARFETQDIITKTDSKGKLSVVKIKPIEYFTKFPFIPNPNGSIYDLGFGLLLGGINETINTLTNQLLDAGTLSTLSAGFMGRGIRIRGGSTRFQPGEWKPVDFTGDDIRKHVFPLPTKEPSDVLFKLLELCVSSGKELASVAEIMVGKMPGQNTPATTTMATIEQGMKVFTAIYKRVYRALGKEYEKLFRLNSLYMDDQVYFTINEPEGDVGQEVYKTDYSPENITVRPNADPNITSSSQKLMQVEAMGKLLALQTINPQVFTKRYLEAIEATNIAELMQVQQQADPEAQKAQAEMAMKQQEHQMKMQLEQLKLQMAEQKNQMDLQFKQMEMAIKERGMQQEMMLDGMKANQDAQISQVQHSQKLEQSAQQHELAKKQMAEKAAQKPAEKPAAKGK